MSLVVAVDPGKKGCGLSVWVDKVLVHAQYVSGNGGEANVLLESVHGVRAVLSELGAIDEVVIEKPKIYDAAHQKGDQRDLIDLAVIVGGIAQVASASTRAVLLVEPHEWKGNTPTDIIEGRMKKHLSAEEIGAVDWVKATSLHHNIWDAIGIGYWRLRS